MLLDPEQETRMGRAFESYLRTHHHDDILQLIEENDGETHRPLIVNAMTLFEANMEVMFKTRKMRKVEPLGHKNIYSVINKIRSILVLSLCNYINHEIIKNGGTFPFWVYREW